MKVLIINTSYEFRTVDYKIINNIKNNHFDIQILNQMNLDFDNFDYDYVFSDTNIKMNKKYYVYIQFFDILNELLYLLFDQNQQKRINFLKPLFHNVEFLLLSGGPTTYELSRDELKILKNKYVIISIKYVICFLKENGIIPDIQVYSRYLSGGIKNLVKHLSHPIKFISFGVQLNDVLNIESKTSRYIMKMNKLKSTHRNTFNQINNNNIGILYWDVTKYTIIPSRGHIVLEVVIPFILLCNIKYLYTYGWDLYNRDKIECDNVGTNGYNGLYNSGGQPTEIVCLKSLKMLLEKKGIKIYKCNKNSKIPFEYFHMTC